MGTADKLLDLMFSWMENREHCAKQLRKLARELEDLKENCNGSQCVGNTVSVVGAASLLGAGVATLITAGLAAPFLALGAAYTFVGVTISLVTQLTEHLSSSKTMKKAQSIESESNEIAEEIKSQFEHLRKVECKAESVNADEDELDQRVMAKIPAAIARRSGQKWTVCDGIKLSSSSGPQFSRNALLNPLMPALADGVFGILVVFAFKASGKKSKLLFAKAGQQLINKMSTTGLKTALEVGDTALKVGGTAVKGAGTALKVGGTAVKGASTALEGAVTAVKVGDTALKGAVTALKGAGTAVKGASTALEGAVTAVKGASTALEGAVTAVKVGDTALKGAVTALKVGGTAVKGASTALKIGRTALKGSMVVGGVVGLAFALDEAIDSWKKMIEKNHVTEASQSLRDTADALDQMSRTRRNQFDDIKTKMANRQREHEERLERERLEEERLERKRLKEERLERERLERERDWRERDWRERDWRTRG
ncbi:uncharacterized protein LOC117551621 [Gymnodraco acuticeps]|uniref:Uncharacterized protein LOC117551621 n=1 Tax=Gymnodraco acuticeps TaxID=8218 RepID=A0A6P8US85_GYMAC|nr:uncharacterized protein LOC117551621 [Gymnodraco acuticeps]